MYADIKIVSMKLDCLQSYSNMAEPDQFVHLYSSHSCIFLQVFTKNENYDYGLEFVQCSAFHHSTYLTLHVVMNSITDQCHTICYRSTDIPTTSLQCLYH